MTVVGPTPTVAPTAGQDPDRLGTGVAFPFLPDPVTGGLDWVSGSLDVEQSVRLILETDPSERVMRPTFGAGLRQYLMDPNTPSTRAQIALDVQAALQTWEPRISVTSVTVVQGDDPSEAVITVSYVTIRDLTQGVVGLTVQTAGTGVGAT